MRGGGEWNRPIVMAGVGHFPKKWLYTLKCVVDISIFTPVEDLQFALYCLITKQNLQDFIDFEIYDLDDRGVVVPFLARLEG